MPRNFPQEVSDHSPADNSTGPHQATSTEYNTSDQIPQLEEEEYPSAQLQYLIPDPDCYRPQPQRSHTHENSCDHTGYYSLPQTQQIFNSGIHMAEENVHICMGIDCLEKRPTQQKVEGQGKGDKISNSVLEIIQPHMCASS